MKELWLSLEKGLSDGIKAKLLKESLNYCDGIIVDKSDFELAKKSGIKVISNSEQADAILIDKVDEKLINSLKNKGKKVAVRLEIKGREDEDLALQAASFSCDYVIIHCLDWKIIPLENLIAKVRGKIKLLAEVSSPSEAKVALETLELGSDGVVLKTLNEEDLKETRDMIEEGLKKRIELSRAKILRLEPIGSGARACIDTCDLMDVGEGLLIGSQSSGFFLIQAEVYENPYVESRPFRVNAGTISLYVLCPQNKTKYLSELKAGDQVLIVSKDGKTRAAAVGRVKIEKRPLMLIEAEHEGKTIKTIVQNAETIRLVTPTGSKSVTDLKPGDEVLAHFEEGGRHFGVLVKDEMVIER
ncbi:MAG: 3-dehydroquinate synthase II [Candidatus Bathyarchaeia archaeon]